MFQCPFEIKYLFLFILVFCFDVVIYKTNGSSKKPKTQRRNVGKSAFYNLKSQEKKYSCKTSLNKIQKKFFNSLICLYNEYNCFEWYHLMSTHYFRFSSKLCFSLGMSPHHRHVNRIILFVEFRGFFNLNDFSELTFCDLTCDFQCLLFVYMYWNLYYAASHVEIILMFILDFEC